MHHEAPDYELILFDTSAIIHGFESVLNKCRNRFRLFGAPKAVLSELYRLSLSATNSCHERAKLALSEVAALVRAGCFYVLDSIGSDTFADKSFLKIASLNAYSCYVKILIITDDRALADDLRNIKRATSSSAFDVTTLNALKSSIFCSSDSHEHKYFN